MRRFDVQFSERNLTGNAGLLHLGRFAEKLRLDKLLQQLIQRSENATYSPADAILMLSMGAPACAKHISHMTVLRADTEIGTLFKWNDFPDSSTFGHIFKLFMPRHCKELCDVDDMSRRKVWSKKFFGKITLDMDSTVRSVFGSQEDAVKGYHPKKRGQKSYHPLLCFIAETRECLHNWFRGGDAYSANGSVQFIKEDFARISKRVWKVIARVDSVFLEWRSDGSSRRKIQPVHDQSEDERP